MGKNHVDDPITTPALRRRARNLNMGDGELLKLAQVANEYAVPSLDLLDRWGAGGVDRDLKQLETVDKEVRELVLAR